MKTKIIKILIGIASSLITINFVLAQNCPEITTVNGPTSITFVGGVVDIGGDTEAKVWFEYGTTSGNYSFQTEKKTINQTGKYCITVTNLQPCTTYYYRAAMENKAGPSYGAEQTRTTPCSGQVLGTATESPTGLVENILKEYILFPLVFAFLAIIFLKSHIIRWEEWLENRKKNYQEFKSEKILKMKIAYLKAKER